MFENEIFLKKLHVMKITQVFNHSSFLLKTKNKLFVFSENKKIKPILRNCFLQFGTHIYLMYASWRILVKVVKKI